MCFNPLARRAAALLFAALLLLLGGCDITDDLIPSGDDERPASGDNVTVGYLPGYVAADFTALDSLGTTFHLADHLAGGAEEADAVVLYFTMWCPICLSHSDHMSYAIIPSVSERGTVRFVLVDYVSGSVELTRATEVANGYGDGPFITLADIDLELFNQFDAAMGTTVVIGKDGVIAMNEDYKDGTKLAETLDQLLP